MSQPLAPRPQHESRLHASDLSSSQRPRKISTACGACKQRKTRVSRAQLASKASADMPQQCTGGTPCEACTTRRSVCHYDASSDQRRKIANQRNVQDLASTQYDLEKHRHLLGGILATIRAGNPEANADLVRVIRSGVDLSQLAAHVRNECRANLMIQEAFEAIEFVIDGPKELPSPAKLLNETYPSVFEHRRQSESNSEHSMTTFTADSSNKTR